MPITNPGLIIAVEALFGFIRPAIINLSKLGATDFGAGQPNVEIKPGATIKVPVSSVSGALPYDEETNNYTTGGDTDWATLVAMHFLKGYDISGTDIDRGVDAGRIEQLFSRRAATGILMAMSDTTATALDGVTLSTGITLPAAPTAEDYLNLMGSVTAKNKVNALGSVLALSGTELGKIKAAFVADGVTPGSHSELAQLLEFGDIVVLPGVTGRMWVVPPTALGFIARVPAYIANYIASGVETDPETGLAIGIVVADVQATNKRVTNADLWFGVTSQSANAGATTAGIIKVGTAQG